jgi:hypothetical protein
MNADELATFVASLPITPHYALLHVGATTTRRKSQASNEKNYM